MKLMLLLMLGSVGIVHPAQAQRAPFSRLTMGGEIGQQVNRTLLHEGWTAPAGVTGRVEFLFYAGTSGLRGTATWHASRRTDVPDFWGLFLAATWHYPIRLSPSLSLAPGGHLGIFQMRFADPAAGEAQKEQEVRLGLAGRLSYRLGGGWRILVEGTYDAVLLSRPLHPFSMRAGVAYTVDLPAWLQNALR